MPIYTPESVRYEEMDPDLRVITPENKDNGNEQEISTLEDVKAENAPDKLFVYTEKYGETTSFLKPGFESNVEKYEGIYEVKVPEEVLKVCDEIQKIAGRALLVGGSVRDTVISTEFPEMNLKPKDYDLEVYGMTVEQLQLVLETTFGSENINTVGKAFGIIKVNIEGWDEPLDFSIPREDSKVDEGHQGFEIKGKPDMKINEAALRRDLTINSIAYDPLTKTLYDAYSGIEDIKNKRIEVTDPEAFQEDPLRVMRIMQFASRFEFTPTENTKELCKEMIERGDMDHLSRERIQEEVKKLLTKGKKPSIGLELGLELGFVKRYWPELYALVGVPQEKDWHPEGEVWKHEMQVVDAAAEVAEREIKNGNLPKDDKIIIVGGALCHDFGKPATTEFIEGAFRSRGHEQAGVDPTREFIERIFGNPKAKEISNVTKKTLPLVAEHLKPKEMWENEVKGRTNKQGEIVRIDQTAAMRRLALRLDRGDMKNYPDGGETTLYHLALIAEADQRGRNGNSSEILSREEVPELEEWQTWFLNKAKELKIEQAAPEKILSGRDILSARPGLTGGTWMGAILGCVFAEQLDGNITSKEEALAAGLAFMDVMQRKVSIEAQLTNIPERTIWERINRQDDPREYLTEA